MGGAAILKVARRVACGLWLAMLVLAAPPVLAETEAAATPSPVAPACHAHSDADIPLAAMLAPGRVWDCNGGGWDDSAPVSWLYFDAASWAGNAPQAFFTRISRFERIDIAAVDRDGAVRSAAHDERSARPIAAGPVFTLPVPAITEATEAVVVRIAGPHSSTMVTEARLTADPESTDWGMEEVLLLAIVAGILVTPLIFDLHFFVILRDRFVLLHAAMVVAMIAYVILAGGLAPLLFDISLVTMAIGAPLAWTIGVAAASFFMVAFLEQEALSPLFRRAMQAMGWWSLFGLSFFGLQFRWTQGFDNLGYFLGFVPVILVYLACLTQAVLRGSRSARFLAIAWVPILAASTERLLRGIGVYAGPSTLDELIYLALALEVMIVALGVADRFVAIRRERDRAVAAALRLSDLSERDPLTGLMNRRAIDLRFGELRASGYEALAVFDLDHFKAVNDAHGHEVGDRVLVTVAQVLRSDPDAFAVRIGGEEFVLMLRGDDIETRVERLRQKIPVKVAREIEALDTMVTASVGLVTAQHESVQDMTFILLYRRADALLYEAKAKGRNMLCSETIDGAARANRPMRGFEPIKIVGGTS